MRLAQRGPARSHGVLQARLPKTDHICVALDHEHFTGARDRRTGPVQVVQDLVLLIDGGLCAVEVLGLLACAGISWKHAGAEGYAPALQVLHGEGDPAAEPVAHGPVVASRGKTGLQQNLRRKVAGRGEPAQQEVRIVGCVPDAKRGDRFCGDPPLDQVGPGLDGFLAVGKHLRVERCGLFVGLDQRGAASGLTALGRRIAFVPELHARLLGKTLDGFHIAQVLQLAQESDRVPSFAAPEAVEDLLGRRHAEAGGLLLMERAKARQRVMPGLLQGKVLGHEFYDVGPLFDGLDVFLLDPAGHASPLLEEPTLGKEEPLVGP